jgi:GTPase SAR1 family protein
MLFYETSAKSGEGVQEMFMALIEKLIIKKREKAKK